MLPSSKLVKASYFSEIEYSRDYSCEVEICWSWFFWMAVIIFGGFIICHGRGVDIMVLVF